MKTLLNIVNEVSSELNPDNLFLAIEIEGFKEGVEMYVKASLFDKIKNLDLKSRYNSNKSKLVDDLFILHSKHFFNQVTLTFSKEYKYD